MKEAFVSFVERVFLEDYRTIFVNLRLRRLIAVPKLHGAAGKE